MLFLSRMGKAGRHHMDVNVNAEVFTNLVLVDGETITREVLADRLSREENFKVMAAGCIKDAADIVTSRAPDIVLIETELPDGSAVSWVSQLKADLPDIKVIFLTNDSNEQTALTAIGLGAEGYVLKSSSYKYLLQAITRVVSEGYVYDPSLTTPIIRRIGRTYYANRRVGDNSRYEELSDREKEITALVSQGLSNDQIAEAMFVSVNTVKTHLRRIYRRLGVSSRSQLVQDRLICKDNSKP
jgi:DNA-binding NarL/FixJ family response regulator